MEKLGLKLRYNLGVHTSNRNSQVVLAVKNVSANAGDTRDAGSIPGLERSPGEEMQPTPVFLPGEFHG